MYRAVSQPVADRDRQILRQVRFLCLLGMALLVVVFGLPDNGSERNVSFFQVARESHWRQFLNLPAAWGSLKIILWSVGLSLFIESLGTLLAVRKRKNLALAVFLLQFLPLLGFLTGAYYFVKAML